MRKSDFSLRAHSKIIFVVP